MALLIAIVIFIILGLVYFRYWIVNHELINRFKDNNVIVFGRKGKGKDLLFQYVINKRKKERYNANITYGGKFNQLDLKMVGLYPNTYENLLKGNIIKLKKQPFNDKEDIYISDAGNYFPSQYDYLLHKEYKSAPLFYSLSRHICDNNIHCNAQNMERIWKPIREQADTYVHVFRKRKYFNLFIRVDYCIYNKYQTALDEVKPIKTKLHKALKEQKKIDESHLGYMKLGHFYIFNKSIKYDTRAFRKIFIEDEEEREKNLDKRDVSLFANESNNSQ